MAERRQTVVYLASIVTERRLETVKQGKISLSHYVDNNKKRLLR